MIAAIESRVRTIPDFPKKGVLEIHEDALKKDSKVVIVDDVLATGGTARAAARLIESLGARIHGIYFLLEIKDLNGRRKLKGHDVHALATC